MWGDIFPHRLKKWGTCPPCHPPNCAHDSSYIRKDTVYVRIQVDISDMDIFDSRSTATSRTQKPFLNPCMHVRWKIMKKVIQRKTGICKSAIELCQAEIGRNKLLIGRNWLETRCSWKILMRIFLSIEVEQNKPWKSFSNKLSMIKYMNRRKV